MGEVSLKDIYNPIRNELSKMEDELSKVINSFATASQISEFKYLFKVKGKRIRPALLILSAKAVSEDLAGEFDDKLIKLSTALELIHNASLIHDDIIDEDMLRRGQKTLNNLYGNKIAVLVGDALNARAFYMISNLEEHQLQVAAIELIEKMSIAEILQIENNASPDKEVYLEVIKAKTALFMEICCGFGATIVKGTPNDVKNLQAYGFNLGMAYQIVDDIIDCDSNAKIFVTFQDAVDHANKCRESLVDVRDSIYKQNLLDFVDIILKFVP